MKENIRTINNCFALRFCALCVLWSTIGCNHKVKVPILERDKWPSFLTDCIDASSLSEAATISLVVYEKNYDEYVFRCDDSDALFESFSTHWELSRVDRNLRFVKNFETRIPTSDVSDDNEFFANPNRREGDKGPQIVVCRSPSRRVMVGHYYFNF